MISVFTANSSWYLYNFRKRTIMEFSRLGRCVVVAPDDEYSEKLEGLDCTFVKISMSPNSINPLNDMITILDYVRIFRISKPDVVFSFTPKANIYSGIACRLFGVKFCPNVSGLGMGASRGWIASIQRVLYRLSFPVAHHVFFQNESDESDMRSILGRGLRSSSLIPGSGVDLTEFRGVEKDLTGAVRFLFMGRLLTAKGVRRYLKAARHFKNKYGDLIEFYLLGFPVLDSAKGVTESELNHLGEYGVEYLGKTDAVYPHLAMAHCVVLPTLYGEGVPKSLIEGAASNCALIASNIAGCTRIVRDRANGFLVDVQTESDFEEAIEQFYQMPENMKRIMFSNSRAYAKKFFDERIVIDAYKSIAQV